MEGIMAEKLSNPEDKGDRYGQHSNLSIKGTRRRCNNEKRSERRARTERLVSAIDNDQVNQRKSFRKI